MRQATIYVSTEGNLRFRAEIWHMEDPLADDFSEEKNEEIKYHCC